MGNRRVTEQPKNDDWIAELFDKAFPEYLAMGMTYRQFWEEDCRLVTAYREAYRIRQDEINRSAWLNGLYIFKALQATPIVVHGFAKRDTKVEPYPGKPYDFTGKPQTAQEKADDEARKEAEKVKRGMMAFMAAQQADRKQKELADLMKNDDEKGVTENA